MVSKEEGAKHMKKLTVCLILALILAAALAVSASADTSGDWRYSVSNGEAMIIGYHGSDTEVTIPSTLGGCIVTGIDKDAFYGHSRLTGITIPDSVTSIGECAFYNCSRLTGITIPDGVTSIGDGAFSNCSSLTSAIIGNGVTSIGDGAFYDCSGLTSVYIDDIAAWCGITFSGYSSNPLYYAHNLYLNGTLVTDLVIPDDVASIGRHAFSGCSSLTGVTIPDSVTSIGEAAFSGCTSLERMTIPFVGGSIKTDDDTIQYPFGYIFGGDSGKGLTQVWLYYFNSSTSTISGSKCYIPSSLRSVTVTGGNILFWAFYGCSMLTDITIPDSATSIGEHAFEGCSGLTGVIIPDSITSIGDSAFYNCSSLISIIIPDSVTSISRGAFNNTAYYSDSTNWENEALYIGNHLICVQNSFRGAFQVKEGTKGIAANAFSGCSSLTGVTIPDGVTSIGERSFNGCSSLTDIIIPDSVTSIGESAFYGCSGLTSVNIPDGVTSIGNYAFYDCSGLSYVFYSGSEAQWNAISIGSNNNGLTIATKYFGNPYSGVCGESLSYSFDPETGVLTLSGSGAMEDYAKKAPWLLFEKEIGSVVLPEGLTGIGQNAFNGCSSLTGVTIPEDVEVMGANAFTGCACLRTAGPAGGDYDIEFPWLQTVPANAFSGADCLESVTLPERLLKLGDWAFYGCKNLRSLRIPATLEVIGRYVVSGCTALDSLGETGSGCALEIPWTSTFLSAFLRNNTALKSVVLPDSLTMIDSGLFSDCGWLTSVTIPDGVTDIGSSAFRNCTGLTDVVFPVSLTRIDNSAFSGCTGLTRLSLPASLTALGSYAFQGCTGLESVTVYGTANIGKNAFRSCTSLKEVRISNGATGIGDLAFYHCNKLKAIYIPRSVTSVGQNAFSDCETLCDVYYSGSEDNWAAMSIGEGNDFLTAANIRYGENALGAAKADVAGVVSAWENGARVYKVTVYCAPDTDAYACGARYDAPGRFLGMELVQLTPGQDNTLTVFRDDGSYIRIYALESGSFAPLTASVNLTA